MRFRKVFIISFLIILQINQIATGSMAERDGRLQIGDRIVSINGKKKKFIHFLASIKREKMKNDYFFQNFSFSIFKYFFLQANLLWQ